MAQLKKIRLPDGAPQTICDISPDFKGASWGDNDVIVYGRVASGLFRVSAGGGASQPLTILGNLL